jgi:hypothetical protein
MQQPEIVKNKHIRSSSRKVKGAAMFEFLIWSAACTSTFLAGIAMIGELSLIRIQTLSAARFVAWQRTAWLPGDPGVVSDLELKALLGATSKKDSEINRDLARHIFRDRAADVKLMHVADNSEFSSSVLPSLTDTTFNASTTLVDLENKLASPTVEITNAISKATAVLGNNNFTNNADNFVFWNRGYIKSQVDIKRTIPKSIFTDDSFSMTEQVSMLVEPWNAGGSVREEAKAQGLVPMKALDSEFNQNIKKTLTGIATTIQYFYPGLNKDSVSWGYSPGDASEGGTPLDRFEQEKDVTGIAKPGHFRFYRSFPPPPSVGTRP